MSYQIRIEKRAIKEMKVLSNEVQIRIKEKVRSVLGENPYPKGNIGAISNPVPDTSICIWPGIDHFSRISRIVLA